MAQQKVRVGVIGATWGERAHVPAVKALPEMELAAVCTAHRETAEAMAQRTGAPKAYSDAAQLLQDPDIDLVTIAVRPALHHPLAEAALKAGKHVYCEWPAALNVAQAQDLVNLARESKRMVMVGLQAQWSPIIMHMRRLMQEEYVGEVLNFAFTQIMSQYQRPTHSGRWWTTVKEEGGSTLFLQGGAVMQVLTWVLGDPTELAAAADVRLKQWTWSDTGETIDVTSPDTLAIALRLKSGAVGTVTVSRVSWNGSGQRLEIYGTEGSLQLTRIESEGRRRQALLGAKDDEPLQELTPPEDLFFVSEVPRYATLFPVAQSFRQLARAIRTGEPTEPGPDTTLSLHRILAAIEQASQEKRWVSAGLGG